MQIERNRLERYFARHEFEVEHLLCSSDCESWSVREILALEPEALNKFLTLRLGYTPSQGDPGLRDQIATLYRELDAEQILVHAGAEEAIFNFMNVVLTKDDHVIVQAPCYQSLAEVARAIGAEVSEWRGDPERGWELDLQRLGDLLTERTALVVVNFPHNPTGFLPDREFLLKLSRLSESRGFLVFSDEVYRGLEFEAADQLPAFADLNERAVSLSVVSKSYGLAGLRIGWIASQNEHLLRELAAFKDYTTICSSAPSEFLATIALQNGEKLLERNRAILRANLHELDGFFSLHCELFDWQPPKAGSIAFPRLRKGEVEDFCARLREECGVLLLPGTVYGAYPKNFRIGFGRKDLLLGLSRFEEFLRAHP